MKRLMFTPRATLTAADTPTADTRRVSGLILPYGESGATSAGEVTVRPGAVRLPDEAKHVKLYRNHSNTGGDPVGYATAIEETENGIRAEFRVAATGDGDTALTDVTEGVRDALSVELLNPVIEGTEIVAAELLAVALVATPAFRSARIDAVTAAHHTTTEETPTMPTDTTPATEAPRPTAGADTQTAAPTNVDGNAVTPATPVAAPAGLSIAPREPEIITAAAVYDAMGRIATGAPVEGRLTAALKAMSVAKSPMSAAPEWLGELWSGIGYTRQFVPLMTAHALTGLELKGWRWKKRPTVADYDGHPAEVPSTDVDGEVVTVKATRIAGANMLPREFIDFNETEVLAAYFRAMAEDYALKSDVKALAEVKAAATEDDKSATFKGDLLKGAAWARRTLQQSVRVEPTAYVVNDADWFGLLDVVADKLPAFLSMIGATPDKFLPTDQVEAGTVLAWNKAAVLHGELPGSPIRANALDIAHGGVAEAVYGYRALLVTDPRGLAKVKFRNG